jgi:hypothetical protein
VDGESRRTRLRSFALGGLLGASAVLAAARRSRPRHRVPGPVGLAAFEDAPCFRELVEDEERALRGGAQRGGGSTP